MSLNFVTGTGTADHDRILAEQINTVLTHDAQAEILVLVPNHIKFESEVAVLKTLQDLRRTPGTADDGVFAQSRIQVMSFSRLAWYYMNTDAIFQKPRLSAPAATMRLARIMADNKDSLRLFAGQAANPGFSARLQKQIGELQMGGVTSADLRAAIGTLTGTTIAPETPATTWQEQMRAAAGDNRHLPKLLDLVNILQAYEQSASDLVSPADLLAALAEHLAHRDLTHTYVYISHFNVFAARELQIVNLLMHKAAELFVAVTTDRPSPHTPEAPDLYLSGKKMYNRLQELAKQPLNDLPPVAIHTSGNTFAATPDRTQSATVRNVERYFAADTAMRIPGQGADRFLTTTTGHPDWQQLTVARATTTYTELRTVARTIRQRVQKEHLRYRDFLIVARHLKPYDTIMTAVFKEFDLPVFIDHEREMKSHPLVVFFDSLFAAREHNYDYQSVFALLRTELLRPADISIENFRHAIDLTENHVLATGMRGYRWHDQDPWVYFRPVNATVKDETDTDGHSTAFDETAQINLIKDLVATNLEPLFAALKDDHTGRELAEIVYTFLNTSGVLQQLTNWRDVANDSGDLETAQSTEQAWQTFCDLLDDFVGTWGDQTLAPDQFANLLDAGFASATYTQIPSTLDQVVVSETGLTRLNHARHVFIIGATSAVMPDATSDTDILTSEDRHVLEPNLPEGCFLPETGADTAVTEPFLNYLAFVAPSESLTISYPVANGGEPSPYLTGLMAAAHCDWTNWQEPTLNDAIPTLLGTQRSLLSDNITVARNAQDAGRALGPDWQVVMDVLRSGSLAGLALQLGASLEYTNAVGHLSVNLAEELYGQNLAVSISRLESFYHNPYEYFLQYGLKLSPRREFMLTPADTGTLFHSVLEKLLLNARKDGGIGNLQPAAMSANIKALVAAEIAKPEFAVLASSARMQFITQLITAALQQSSWAVQREQLKSGLTNRRTELNFGMGDGLPALEVGLTNNRKVLVRGRIDRLDTVDLGNNQSGFMVVDYKSSDHDFDNNDAYYGLDMQMLTYIQAIRDQGSTPDEIMVPIAAMFMRIQNPLLKLDDKKITQFSEDERIGKLLGEMRMQGLMIEGDGLLKLDTGITDTAGQNFVGPAKSDFFKMTVKKDGQFDRYTKVISLDEMSDFVDNNDALIAYAAEQILSGFINLSPQQFDQSTDTITRSDYAAIMQFDPTLRDNRYRRLPKLTFEQIVDKIKNGERAYPNFMNPTQKEN